MKRLKSFIRATMFDSSLAKKVNKLFLDGKNFDVQPYVRIQHIFLRDTRFILHLITHMILNGQDRCDICTRKLHTEAKHASEPK